VTQCMAVPARRGTTLREMRFAPSLLCVLVLSAAVLPATAQWVWKDRNGRVTASDLPPPRDIPERDVLQRPDTAKRTPAAAAAPASAASAALPAKPSTDPALEAKRRAAEQEQQAKSRAEADKLAAQRADNCRRARTQLGTLESGQRIARTNDKGEREFLDDKARADEVRRANEVIASDCR
jgi:hypothetical protein